MRRKTVIGVIGDHCGRDAGCSICPRDCGNMAKLDV